MAAPVYVSNETVEAVTTTSFCYLGCPLTIDANSWPDV